MVAVAFEFVGSNVVVVVEGGVVLFGIPGNIERRGKVEDEEVERAEDIEEEERLEVVVGLAVVVGVDTKDVGAVKGETVDGFTVARNWSMFCMVSLLRLTDSSMSVEEDDGEVEESFGELLSNRVRTD